MNRHITKRVFAEFQDCPKDVWLRLNKPEFLDACKLSDFEKYLMEQGNEVEAHARKLFPGGVEVLTRGEEARQETLKLMEQKIPTIFQATFIADRFIARNDMLSFNAETSAWDLYEVKSSNAGLGESRKEQDNITDIAFQGVVMKRSGINVGRYFLVRLNKEYVRIGDLNYKDLFVIDDKTEEVQGRMETIEPQMEVAREFLGRETELGISCDCVYKTRTNHCATFSHTNPEVPEYSIHDISRISPKKLQLLVERRIYDLADIPEDFDLTEKQKNQVDATRRIAPSIDHDEIRRELSGLKYPLHFLDYEAYGPAVPMYNGFSPYKRVPFQFSMHIVRESGGPMEHVEYLHEDQTDPTEAVGAMLEKHIDPNGTTIAWYKSFEAGVNREIGERASAFAGFFEKVNAGLYDLMDIFQKQHYIHAGFRGRASIKYVLPTLLPAFSYAELGIQKGDQAAQAWFKLIDPKTPAAEKAQISSDLKAYCARDSEAMVVIWKHLCDLVK